MASIITFSSASMNFSSIRVNVKYIFAEFLFQLFGRFSLLVHLKLFNCFVLWRYLFKKICLYFMLNKHFFPFNNFDLLQRPFLSSSSSHIHQTFYQSDLEYSIEMHLHFIIMLFDYKFRKMLEIADKRTN